MLTHHAPEPADDPSAGFRSYAWSAFPPGSKSSSSCGKLHYMRAFAAAWPEFVPQAVGQIPWGHIVAIGTHTDLPTEVRAVLPSAEELARAMEPALREDCGEETGPSDLMDSVVDPWEGERI